MIIYRCPTQFRDTFPCFHGFFHNICLKLTSSPQLFDGWRFLVPESQTLVCRWIEQLDPAPTTVQSFCRLQFFLFFFLFFSCSILKYHGILQGTSKSEGRIRIDLEILFEISSDAFPEYFFCRYCTFLENGWHADYSQEKRGSQGSCQNLPRKCPSCQDGGLSLLGTSRLALAFHLCFHRPNQSSWLVFWALLREPCRGSR